MTMALRMLALALVLASGTVHAGLFGSKPKKAPAPAPVAIVAPTPPPLPPPPPPPPPPIPLEFSGVQTAPPVPAPVDRLLSAPAEVQSVVQWVGASHDNGGLPFLVVDKVNARAYAFTPAAQLKATAPILLGRGKGDVMLVPNDAPMSAIPPEKRITPAGRYRSWLVRDSHGVQVLSIDYDAAISMHIVVPGTPAEKRAARLASETAEDNRVSFGCINVPPGFFTQIVSPDFTPAKGIVYILPETRTAGELFGFAPRPTPSLTPQAPVTATELRASPVSPQLAPTTSGTAAPAAPFSGSN